MYVTIVLAGQKIKKKTYKNIISIDIIYFNVIIGQRRKETVEFIGGSLFRTKSCTFQIHVSVSGNHCVYNETVSV